MSKDGESLRLTVLGNGLDFVHSALDNLDDPSAQLAHKYAVLHLAAGIELILKARLVQANWSLVFQEPMKADWTAFAAGDFRSVGLEEAIARLTETCGLTITKHTENRLRTFKTMRNKLEHFAVAISLDALRAQAAIVLADVVDFLGHEFPGTEIPAAEAEEVERLRSRVAAFEEFRTERLAAIEPSLSEARIGGQGIVVCPSCGQEALAAGDPFRCHFCGRIEMGPELLDSYLADSLQMDEYSVVTGGGEWPLYNCPECDQQTLVYAPHDCEYAVCFSCGESWRAESMQQCSWCNAPYPDPNDDAGVLCFDCLSSVR